MKIVSIGAHPDDVEQGMGGTLAKHSRNADDVHIVLCTLGIGERSGDQKRRQEEAQTAARILGAKLHSLDYPVLKINKPSAEFKNIIKDILDDISPDRVYVHSPFDYHQIHAAVSDCSTRAAVGVKQLLYYEVISSTNPDFRPNAYVEITNYMDLKLKSIRAHKTQSSKHYLKSGLIRSLAYVRYSLGKLGSNPIGMAEAFAVQRFIVLKRSSDTSDKYNGLEFTF